MNFKESVKKFRAYDAHNKKFAFVGFHVLGEVTLLGALEIYKHENKINFEQTLELKITQFTGLLDSKGVEIYEGDIVQFDGITHHGKIVTGVVFYVAEKHRYEYGAPNVISNPFWSMPTPTIIGNYYETPQLLD